MPPAKPVSSDEEDEGEGGEGYVTKNPVGEFHGHRNDKNERHGRGRAVLPNGDLYLGCYYRGQRHGLGCYRYKNGNGARYGGDWTFGEKHGWGTFYYPDAAQYTGNWAHGIKHGWGVYVYPNGDEYEGWWYWGNRNGRGIYRTKKTGEKFIGNWVLGKRQGEGMIIRKHHRFIGNWYNDVPRGVGVYVFPELGCEQHGKYTHMKALPGSEERLIASGNQVRLIRSAQPPLDPVSIEKEKLEYFMKAIEEEGGEDYFAAGEGGALEMLKAREFIKATEAADAAAKLALPIPEVPKDNPDSLAEGSVPIPPEPAGVMMSPTARADHLIHVYMKNWVEEQKKDDDIRIPVVPMWRVTHVTGLFTSIPDETVPPPPMPPTPQPPIEVEPEVKVDEAAAKAAEESEDPIVQARRLAMTHQLSPAFSGVCQPSSIQIKIPPDTEPYSRFSELNFANLDDFRAGIEATGGQLEPFNIEEAIRANQQFMRTHGLEVADRWRGNLGADGKCQMPNVPIPPGGVTPLTATTAPTDGAGTRPGLLDGILTDEEEYEEAPLTDTEMEDTTKRYY